MVISDMLSFTFYRDILVESNLGSDELTTINQKVGKQNGLRVILDQVFDKNYNADLINIWLLNLFYYNLKFKLKASGNTEFGTVFDATNSFDLYVGSGKEFPMMKLRYIFLLKDWSLWFLKAWMKK